jgi:hypothetical protein
MINLITIEIDLFEYQLLRQVTFRQNVMVTSHFKIHKSYTIAPEIIVATLFDSIFQVSAENLKLSKAGIKKIKLHYYQAQALFSILGLYTTNEVQSIRDKLDRGLTNWIPKNSSDSREEFYEFIYKLDNYFVIF